MIQAWMDSKRLAAASVNRRAPARNAPIRSAETANTGDVRMCRTDADLRVVSSFGGGAPLRAASAAIEGPPFRLSASRHDGPLDETQRKVTPVRRLGCEPQGRRRGL